VRLYLHQTEVEVLKAKLDRILADTNNRTDGLISLRINPQPDLFRKVGDYIVIGNTDDLAGAILSFHADTKALLRDIEDAIKRQDL
jgi:hypothetical protein